MGFAVLWAFFYLTVSIAVAVQAHNHAQLGQGRSFAPAAFFGLITMCIYGSQAWLMFKQWKIEEFEAEMQAEMDNADPFA